MYKNYSYYQNTNERFIGPLLPFIGGALVGYVVGRPNNFGYYQQQPYYPAYYYQYPTYPYYYQTNTYNLN
jgi:hypothetical protein